MSYKFTDLDALLYWAAMPLIVLLGSSLILMMQSVSKKFAGQKAVALVSYTTMLIATLLSLVPSLAPGAIFLKGSYTTDGLAKFGQTAILLVSLITLVVLQASNYRKHFFRGDMAAIFFMTVSGMLIMVSTKELISAFIGLELASIGIYTMVGYVDPSRRSQEGAIKYLILGSLAAALLLFGMALLYAATGSLYISEMTSRLAAVKNQELNVWAQFGLLFFVSGLAFKMALVPFHMWAPDAYEAAPTPITAFMATSVKVMVLVFALRFAPALGESIIGSYWAPWFGALAVLSVLAANVMALVQGSLKRMLAYSSVAHSGYMAFALCSFSAEGAKVSMSALLMYVAGYSIVSMGVFSIVTWLETEHEQNLHLDDLNGLSKTHPWTAAALAALMFGLAGLPPASGFITKFFVFRAAIASDHFGLTIAGAVGSSIALFYYLRVIVRMYMTPNDERALKLNSQKSYSIAAICVISVVLMLALGTILPSRVITMMERVSAQESH